MTFRFEDAKNIADVEEVRRLARDFARPAYGEEDNELGEPYITGELSEWEAAFVACLCLIIGALFLAVVVIQGGRWLL